MSFSQVEVSLSLSLILKSTSCCVFSVVDFLCSINQLDSFLSFSDSRWEELALEKIYTVISTTCYYLVITRSPVKFSLYSLNPFNRRLQAHHRHFSSALYSQVYRVCSSDKLAGFLTTSAGLDKQGLVPGSLVPPLSLHTFPQHWDSSQFPEKLDQLT